MGSYILFVFLGSTVATNQVYSLEACEAYGRLSAQSYKDSTPVCVATEKVKALDEARRKDNG